jgi:ribosomal protein L37AE/L43A
MPEIRCVNCSEGWDVEYVLHKASQEFQRKGSLIYACPSCEGKKIELTAKQIWICNQTRNIGERFQGDIYGAAEAFEHLENVM